VDKQKVEIAAKLYEARDTIIGLMGKEKFKMRVEEFRPIMAGMCKKEGMTEMQATLEILKSLDQGAITSLLAMAACVEIMEPSIEL